MLQEILMSLSGVQSSIWQQVKDGQGAGGSQITAYMSPAERSMLETLGELAELHIKVREVAVKVTNDHASTICRAVGSRVSAKHLRDFTQKILEVERSILQEDSSYVGAYKIVPLSTIVTEFQPWQRPLRWLNRVMRQIQTHDSGVILMGFLAEESRTGYTDIHSLSQDLLTSAQQSWMQSLAPWLLFGRLPLHAQADFMIQHKPEEIEDEEHYTLRADRIPHFVSRDCAEAIVAVGKALNQLQHQTSASGHRMSSVNMHNALVSENSQHIKNVTFPVQSASFEKVVASIDENISQAALSQLLPADEIVKLLEIIQQYVLLKSGEFATCLINEVRGQLESRTRQDRISQPIRKLGKPFNVEINDIETSTVLKKAFQELAALIPDDDAEELYLRQAMKCLNLSSNQKHASPVNTLIPNGAALTISLSADSPLRMFLNTKDVLNYRDISSFLISLRRAKLHLTELWHIPEHRRRYPVSIHSSRNTTKSRIRKQRDDRRHTMMRPHWAAVSQTSYVITEIESYLHGEVIEKSWHHLNNWLNQSPDHTTNSASVSSRYSSRPVTASSHLPPPAWTTGLDTEALKSSTHSTRFRSRDPRAISAAHRQYLSQLRNALLLDNTAHILAMNNLLQTLDHYTALFHRLATTWTGLDLQEDDGVIDAFSNYAKEEQEIMAEMARTSKSTRSLTQELVETIRAAEKQRADRTLTSGTVHVGLTQDQSKFVPWSVRTLDRLIMKLDFLSGDRDDDDGNKLVESDEEWHDA